MCVRAAARRTGKLEYESPPKTLRTFSLLPHIRYSERRPSVPGRCSATRVVCFTDSRRRRANRPDSRSGRRSACSRAARWPAAGLARAAASGALPAVTAGRRRRRPRPSRARRPAPTGTPPPPARAVERAASVPARRRTLSSESSPRTFFAPVAMTTIGGADGGVERSSRVRLRRGVAAHRAPHTSAWSEDGILRVEHPAHRARLPGDDVMRSGATGTAARRRSRQRLPLRRFGAADALWRRLRTPGRCGVSCPRCAAKKSNYGALLLARDTVRVAD